MSRLEFRIIGFTEKHQDEWRRQGARSESAIRSGSGGRAQVWHWLATHLSTRTLLLLIFAGTAATLLSSAGSSLQDVRWRRVLVLLDRSGSMGSTTERTQQQLAALQSHNISVTDPQSISGYAISAANPSWSFLQPLIDVVKRHPEADTIYVISDFKGGDEADNDAAGYQQLRDLLRERRLRLYFATVDQSPPLAVYRDIAAASGGGVIEEYKNSQLQR